MSTQRTEALRLAEILELGYRQFNKEAAAELRRLHALNAELLEALKELVEAYERAGPGLSRAERAVDRMRLNEARIAIAKAEGREE